MAVGLAAGDDGQVRHVACLNSFLDPSTAKIQKIKTINRRDAFGHFQFPCT